MKIELAGCVVLDDYGRLLLLHRNTPELSWWELPGGKVESEESPEDAAVREMGEELGIRVELQKKLGVGEFEYDENEYRYTWFLATFTGGEPTLFEPEKFDDFDYFEVEDMMSLALSVNMLVLLEKIVSGEVALEA